jgi:hypothetical protein
MAAFKAYTKAGTESNGVIKILVFVQFFNLYGRCRDFS